MHASIGTGHGQAGGRERGGRWSVGSGGALAYELALGYSTIHNI